MKAVRVSFEENAKYFYFDPNNIELEDGEIVIVDTNGCKDNGKIVGDIFDLDEKKFSIELKKVIRKTTKEDIRRIESNAEAEEGYFKIFKEKVIKNKLDNIKPLRASLSFDGRKITFFYFSEKKIDFRELLKDLLAAIKKKIELRQVEAREEVKLVGGMGICGQRCCCNLFLSGRDQVGIKMAKEQGLVLNPEKISGTCGKLMCCLKFENETYKKQAKGMPKKNNKFFIDKEEMKVVDSNILLEQIKLRKVLKEKDDYGNNLLADEVLVLTKEEFLKKTAEK